MLLFNTHADDSLVSKAIIRVCVPVCDSVYLSLRAIKTKTAESTITKLGTGIAIPRPSMNIRSKVKLGLGE